MAKLLWEWKPRFAIALVVCDLLIVTSHTNCDVTSCPVVMRHYASANGDEQRYKMSKTLNPDLYGLRCRGWYCNPEQHSLCRPARLQAAAQRPAQLVLFRIAVPTTPAQTVWWSIPIVMATGGSGGQWWHCLNKWPLGHNTLPYTYGVLCAHCGSGRSGIGNCMMTWNPYNPRAIKQANINEYTIRVCLYQDHIYLYYKYMSKPRPLYLSDGDLCAWANGRLNLSTPESCSSNVDTNIFNLIIQKSSLDTSFEIALRSTTQNLSNEKSTLL